jgi:hypothetical protein
VAVISTAFSYNSETNSRKSERETGDWTRYGALASVTLV